MLRVDPSRFFGGHTKESRIEFAKTVDEASVSLVNLPGNPVIRIVECVYVPTIGRDLTNRVFSSLEKVPKFIWPIGVTGESTTKADDRNLFHHFSLHR